MSKAGTCNHAYRNIMAIDTAYKSQPDCALDPRSTQIHAPEAWHGRSHNSYQKRNRKRNSLQRAHRPRSVHTLHVAVSHVEYIRSGSPTTGPSIHVKLHQLHRNTYTSSQSGLARCSVAHRHSHALDCPHATPVAPPCATPSPHHSPPRSKQQHACLAGDTDAYCVRKRSYFHLHFQCPLLQPLRSSVP